MLSRKISVDVEPSPEELAFEFTIMSDSQQAAFFNELARLTEQWTTPLCFQMQWITDNAALTDGARNVMKTIGDYATKPEVSQ